MANNLMKCVIHSNNLQILRKIQILSPILTRSLSTDGQKEVSRDVKSFDQKLSQDIKEKVLNRETHTGQTFAENDFRLVRFVGKEKEINPRFAIDLIAEAPPIAAKEHWVSCDGGGGPLGHPKVFINLDDPGEYGTCGYCGLRFYKEGHSSHH